MSLFEKSPTSIDRVGQIEHPRGCFDSGSVSLRIMGSVAAG